MRQWMWPAFRSLYGHVDYIGIRRESGDMILAHAADQGMTLQLVIWGGRLVPPLTHAIEILSADGRSLDGWFVDVGANIGTETIAALRSGFARVLAIEPETMNRRLLEANLIVNGLADRAAIRAAAISNRRGSVRMALSATNRGDHRVIENRALPIGHIAGEQVDMLPLADLVAENRIHPDEISLVWVDAQGYDGFVLDGARPLISAGVPFVIEFWPEEMRILGCLDLVLDLIESEFGTYHHLNAEHWRSAQRTDTIRAFAATMRGRDEADLLLLPRADH
jgi:FkbM family methyltransferase